MCAHVASFRPARRTWSQVWRLALPTNCVVAVQLTEPVLRAVFATNGLQFDPSRPFLRRDTWHSEDKPGCAACPLGVTRQGDRTMRGGSAFSVQRPSLCLPRRRTEVSAGDYLVGDITFTEPPLVGPLVQSGGEARPCWLWKTTNKVRSRVQPPRSRGDVSRGSSGRGCQPAFNSKLRAVFAGGGRADAHHAHSEPCDVFADVPPPGALRGRIAEAG